MPRFAAHVAQGCSQVIPDGVLHRQVLIHGVGSVCVFVPACERWHVRSIRGGSGAGFKEEAIAWAWSVGCRGLLVGIAVAVGESLLDVVRVVCPKVDVIAQVLDTIVEEPKSGANNHLVADLVGAADSWREVEVLRIQQATIAAESNGDVTRCQVRVNERTELHAFLGDGENVSAGPGACYVDGTGGIELGLRVSSFNGRREEVIAHTEVNRETPVDLPIVLEVSSAIPVAVDCRSGVGYIGVVHTRALRTTVSRCTLGMRGIAVGEEIGQAIA